LGQENSGYGSGNGEKSFDLANVIETAIQVPGVKVNRETFLRERFKNKSPEELNEIIELGPVDAKCSRKELRKMADRIVSERTLFSTGASFVAGLPGGLALAASIPADLIQFYAVTLRLAQEVAYLYGEQDLWSGEWLDSEKVTNQLILYCGVMLGASGASQMVRVVSSSLAKQALKKLPQQALMKTFYYPVIKSIAKALGARMTKEIFAKGVSKAIPVIGGVVSGGITFATMRPMGIRLVDALDEAHFSYSESEFESDWKDVVLVCNDAEFTEEPSSDAAPCEEKKTVGSSNGILDQIKQAKELLDAGVIGEEEFAAIKAKLISQM